MLVLAQLCASVLRGGKGKREQKMRAKATGRKCGEEKKKQSLLGAGLFIWKYGCTLILWWLFVQPIAALPALWGSTHGPASHPLPHWLMGCQQWKRQLIEAPHSSLSSHKRNTASSVENNTHVVDVGSKCLIQTI